jgi:hypothetical protein
MPPRAKICLTFNYPTHTCSRALIRQGLDVVGDRRAAAASAAWWKSVAELSSDVSDAAWLADLGAHGSVTASLVPPPPIRALRDLTRAGTHITRERSPSLRDWRSTTGSSTKQAGA